MPTGFQFKEARVSKQTNIKQAGDVVSEAFEPDDSHTIVLNNFTGGGLAAHKLESFARSDKTNATVGRQSVEKNLTKEGLMVGALGAESNPYSAAANVVADVAVAEGVPGASYVQSGLTAASVYGMVSAMAEGVTAGMAAGAALPELAAAAAVPTSSPLPLGGAAQRVGERRVARKLEPEPRPAAQCLVDLRDDTRRRARERKRARERENKPSPSQPKEREMTTRPIAGGTRS